MRNLCCVMCLLLLMQTAFTADVAATDKIQAMLAPHSSDTGLPPSFSLEDDPDSEQPLPALSHSSPAREQRINSKNYILPLGANQAFQPRGPPYTFFA
ncbi:hypothetical protein [Oceanisphaera sp. KMM 10153]|uniref:hypothetical protein n=1 Tax=Oceanisphaera submarina TaxID=3390193 RepID=UPI003974CB69